EEEQEQEQEQVQVQGIAGFIKLLPAYMNTMDRYYLRILLYQIGIVDDYLNAVVNGTEEDDHKVKFDTYFDGKEDIKIDPKTGKITFLRLYRHYYDEEDEYFRTFDLPPIIEYFDKLESVELYGCQLIPDSFGNLMLLKEITLCDCPTDVFENIPEGLRLPSTKKVMVYTSEFGSSLSTFLQVFSNTLEELCFLSLEREESNKVLHALQNDDLCFRRSLKVIMIGGCELNENDLELLLFDVRPKFPDLHEINVVMNQIKSLLGVEDRFNQLQAVSLSRNVQTNNNNLRKLNLSLNPVFNDKNPKEKAALLTLLDTFNGISNLGRGLGTNGDVYDPDVEHILRINHAGRKYISSTMGSDNNPKINRSLWPIILERTYKKSSEIYDTYEWDSQESKDRKKCSTGLFHLVHQYWPMFIENHRCRTQYDEVVVDDGSKNQDTRHNRKRKYREA
ncbi:MAG: hypothetical protein ACI8RD_014756, partial [Bacillariaceae sp.]